MEVSLTTEMRKYTQEFQSPLENIDLQLPKCGKKNIQQSISFTDKKV